MASTPGKLFKRSRDPHIQTEEWKQLQEAVRQDELRKCEQTPSSVTVLSPTEETDVKNGCNAYSRYG